MPDLTEEQWEQFARRQYAEDASGMIHLEYDSRFGDALRSGGSGLPDAWALFDALSTVPILAFRGAISNVLSATVFDKMVELKPDLKRVIVPNRGHVPLLDEPECKKALEDFFAAYRMDQVWRRGQMPAVDAGLTARVTNSAPIAGDQDALFFPSRASPVDPCARCFVG